MKKLKALFATLVLALFLLAALITPKHALAQGVNWVVLQSDTTAITTPGQVVTVALRGSLNVPISRATMTLRYDPACFRVISLRPGSLLPGAVAYAQAQAGQFDLSYNLPGDRLGLTGEGSLASMQLEALQVCSSDLSVAPNSISLAVLDTHGLATNLPGVEYRSLSIHLLQSLVPANGSLILPTKAQTGLQNSGNDLLFLVLILLPISGTIMYFLRRRSKRAGKLSATPKLFSVGSEKHVTRSRRENLS